MRIDLIEKLAAHNVLDESVGRYIEVAYRHYSKTYNTALHVAKQILPIEEALLIFFEDQMEGIKQPELGEIIADIFRRPSPEDVNTGKDVAPKANFSDDDWIAQQNAKLKKIAEEKAKAEEAKKAQEIVKSVDDVIEKFNKSMKNIKDNIKKK